MHGGKSTIILIAYFLGLAVVVGGLASVGIKVNEQTIIGGMVVVAGVFAVIWLMAKWIKRKMSRAGYNRRQFVARMFGAPAEIVDAIPSTAVVVSSDMSMVPYAGEDEDWSTFIEPGGLDFSPVFKPSIHSVLGKTVSVFGIRRSGKSTCVTDIVEELATHRLPMLICDTKDEYAGLVDPKYLPNCWMAGAAGATANVPDSARFYYVALDESGAVQFGKNLMNGTWQVVLNLRSYETDDQAARVMCGIIRGINEWEETRANRDRIPVEVVLDEGHKWLPQNEKPDFSEETRVLLHKTFFSTIVRLGGFNGFGFIVASQRISELDKRCLQSDWRFLFKQSEAIDLAKYEGWNLKRDDVQSLQQGECFVFSPSVLGMRIKMRAKHSPDLSMTPGLDQLVKHRNQAQAMSNHLARHTSYTRQLDTRQDEPAREDPDTDPGFETPAALPDDLQDAYEWYTAGKHSGRALAAAMDITTDRAYVLLNKLEARGYIKLDRKVSV